jgi:uncharacterized membrane protein YhaH (DUF805 family)
LRTFDFKGRATRSEFWWLHLFWALSSFLVEWLDNLFFKGLGPYHTMGLDAVIQNLRFDPILTLHTAILSISALSLLKRRLHDIGWPAFLFLLGISYLLGPFLHYGLEAQNYNDYVPSDPLATPKALHFFLDPIDIIVIVVFLIMVVTLIVGFPKSKPENRYGPNPWLGPISKVFL